MLCKNFHFRADGDTHTSYTNWVTWVEWISTGLSGSALRKWRNLDSRPIFWFQYSAWIIATFSSPLTKQQALEAFQKIRQTGTATSYTKYFDSILNSLKSCGYNMDPNYIMDIYRHGLRPGLQTLEAIRMATTLKDLQNAADQLDDVAYKDPEAAKNFRLPSSHKQHNGNGHTNGHHHSTTQQSSNSAQGDDPMDLDNIRAKGKKNFRPSQRLNTTHSRPTKNERRQADPNVCRYCKQPGHQIEDCPSPDCRQSKAHQAKKTTVNTTTATSVERGTNPSA
ncbi:hypothetical protein HDU96_004612 [Phlyctochytrium bullatum]|nr:hypothetical protein HDU96_004612 [Phlyctochytrium bullatum]